MPSAARPFYGSFAWAYDQLSERAVTTECGHVVAVLAGRGVATGAALLDAGCGTGRYAVELAEHGYRVTGLDASPDLLDVARRRPGASAVDFVEADLVKLPAAPHYDAILCRGVLNDVIEDTDRRDAFQAFARALSAGGVLMFDVREWEATAERKTREPVHETTIDTSQGTLTFRSHARLDSATRQLRIAERHVLTAGQVTTTAVYDFVMRCWTRDEIQHLLGRAGFVAPVYRGGYDPTLTDGSTDRLVVVASRP
jgi:SAM-dependent methyltransferase